MNQELLLEQGLRKAFMDKDCPAYARFTPSLLYNDYRKGEKVFCTLERELAVCTSFSFSVAFVTAGGVQLFKPLLRELARRHVPGQILTTNYQCFTQPDALDFLDSFDNIEVRLYDCLTTLDGFHTKGYMFGQPDGSMVAITGSSNLTASALTYNQEWNTRLLSTSQGSFAQDMNARFEELWNSVNTISWDKIAPRYRTQYAHSEMQRQHQAEDTLLQTVVHPNAMQADFINNLHKLIRQKENRALLISATGTGKTYAAAFAVQDLKPKRVLFLVHRAQIARKSLSSFKQVLQDTYEYGLLGDGYHDIEADCLFSTVQTMARADQLRQFSPDAFDMIIIDEVHRAAADSYQRIFDYFTPAFWLGMSATPERTDGRSIFELFDHNVACEIRLQHALEEDLLCPFHYYALTDLEIDGETARDISDFRYLTDDRRLEHIIQEAQYYGFSGDRVKGLMFVSTIEEARTLSRKLNENGWRTLALSGENSQQQREEAIARLTQEHDSRYALDYLVTVDIFNEGVDIPEVNQILLLRPTKSSIIFLQQLGRGLRKSPGKEFVTVLDFIGAYTNNWMIPDAFTENQTQDKDKLRRFVQEGSRVLPGASTVYFDEVSRRQIFHSIETVKLNQLGPLKNAWLNVRDRLGHVPALVEFDASNGIDPLRLIRRKDTPSYPDWLARMKVGHSLNETQLDLLRYISRDWASGRRSAELEVLRSLADTGQADLSGYPHHLQVNLRNQFTRQWRTRTTTSVYPRAQFAKARDSVLVREEAFTEALRSPEFRAHFEDVISFGLSRVTSADNGPVINERYTYEETFRMLNFPIMIPPFNVGGYFYQSDVKAFPVYINYEKAPDIKESIAYEDRFISRKVLLAWSKNHRNMESKDMQRIANASDLHISIHLFLRKNTKDQDKEFYYLGRMHARHMEYVPEKDGVAITYELEQPVRADLYDYFTN